MQPSTVIKNNNLGPLSPLNLLIAGVSAGDVVWFKRLKPADQMRSLHQSERGASILAKVREHEGRKLSRGMAVPQLA